MHEKEIKRWLHTMLPWVVVGGALTILIPVGIWWYSDTMECGILEAVGIGGFFTLFIGMFLSIPLYLFGYSLGCFVEAVLLVCLLLSSPSRWRSLLKELGWSIGKTVGGVGLLLGVLVIFTDGELVKGLLISDVMGLKILGIVVAGIGIGLALIHEPWFIFIINYIKKKSKKF